MATDDDHNNRPVEITFTKWGVTAPPLPAPQPPFGLFEGFSDDGLPGSFVAEVLWRQLSLNGHVTGLEAMYEVVDGDRSFTALIRGGSNAAGVGLLDGVILAGWRTGARVQVVFQRYVAIAGRPSCDGRTRRTRTVSWEPSTSGAPQGTEASRLTLIRRQHRAWPAPQHLCLLGVNRWPHRARFIDTISVLFRSRSNTICVPSGDTSKFWITGPAVRSVN